MNRVSRRNLDWFKLLAELAQASAGARDMAEVLRLIVAAVLKTGLVDRAGVHFRSRTNPRAMGGTWGVDMKGRVQRIRERFVFQPRSPLGYAFRSKSGIFLSPDLHKDARVSPRSRQAHAPEVKALGVIALRCRGENLGSLSVDNALSGRPLRKRDLEALLPFAAHAASAIENVRLLRGARQRAEALDLINEVAQKCLATESLNERMGIVAQAVARLTRSQGATVFFTDESTGGLWVECALGSGRDVLKGQAIAKGEGLAGWVAEHRESQIVQDVREDGRFVIRPDAAEGFETRSILSAPMVFGNRVLGVIEALNKGGDGWYTKEDKGLLEILARQAAVTIENSRLLHKEKANVAKLNVLRQAAENMSYHLEFKKLMRFILDTVMGALWADAGSIMLLDEKGQNLKVIVSQGLPEGVSESAEMPVPVAHSVAGAVIQSGEAALLQAGLDGSAFSKFGPSKRDIRSAISCPIVEYDIEYEGDPQAKKVIGVININRLRKTEPFSEEDRDFLLGLSHQIAIAVRNAKMYQEQKRLVEELKELDKTRSQFISAVTHELRTPLVSLKGYASLLLANWARVEDKQKLESLEHVRSNSARLESLVNQVLAVSGIEKGTFSIAPKPTDLKALAEGTARVLAGLSRAHRVELAWEACPGEVVCDPQRIEQVMLNLLSNAAKYWPQGGVIQLKAAGDSAEIRISVSDQGLGIPKEQQAGLFQRFSRVQAASHKGIEGTGIGLYLVREIVEAHGGRVGLESEPGRGSTFWFTLPRVKAAA